MLRIITPAAALAAVLTTASIASAGFPPFPGQYRSSYRSPHHDTLNLVALDGAADRLAAVLSHLHEDAYELSPAYRHTAAVKRYVAAAEQLQHHLHDVLHEAASCPSVTTRLRRHVESDIREVAELIARLDNELRHQGYDGACPADYRHIVHMRSIIQNEAFPLVDQMNALIGARGHDVHHSGRFTPAYPVPTPGYDVDYNDPRSYRPAISIGTGGFRISWGR